MEANSNGTPASRWSANGELDPHAGHYDGPRESLPMGNLTDDDLANGAFMNFDVRPPLQAIIDGKAFSPIGWMTAVKDRIRWLSRRLISAERDRDDLRKALGSGGRHCNDDTPSSDLCEAIIDSKEADVGQGLNPYWKWAFRRGFYEAETSYKVEIATLEQQRDTLLEELKIIRGHTDADDPESYRSDDREGCLDAVFSRANSAIESVAKR